MMYLSMHGPRIIESHSVSASGGSYTAPYQKRAADISIPVSCRWSKTCLMAVKTISFTWKQLSGKSVLFVSLGDQIVCQTF